MDMVRAAVLPTGEVLRAVTENGSRTREEETKGGATQLLDCGLHSRRIGEIRSHTL